MSSGHADGTTSTGLIEGLVTGTAGAFYVEPSVDAVGHVTALFCASIVGADDEGFAAKLSAAYQMSGGTLALIGAVEVDMAVRATTLAAGVAVDLDADPATHTIRARVTGLDGVTFDVDVRWSQWATA